MLKLLKMYFTGSLIFTLKAAWKMNNRCINFCKLLFVYLYYMIYIFADQIYFVPPVSLYTQYAYTTTMWICVHMHYLYDIASVCVSVCLTVTMIAMSSGLRTSAVEYKFVPTRTAVVACTYV